MNDEIKRKWLEREFSKQKIGDSVEDKKKWLKWQIDNPYEDSQVYKKAMKKVKKEKKEEKDNTMTTFKIGDKVRLLSTDSENARFFHGDFNNLTIDKKYSNGYDYIVKNGSGVTVGVRASEIELVSNESKFGVGQLVSFKSKTSANAQYFHGTLEGLEIKGISKNSPKKYHVWEHDKATSWTVNEDELEHYEFLATPKDGFKIGDLVDINTNHPDAPNTFTRWFKDGTTGLRILDVDSGHYNIETKNADNSWWVDADFLSSHGASEVPEVFFYDAQELERLTHGISSAKDVKALTLGEAAALLNRHYIFLMSDENGLLVGDKKIPLSSKVYDELKSTIKGKLLVAQKYYKKRTDSKEEISSVYVYDVQVSQADIKKDLSQDVETIWKNPKPNVKNQKEINEGDLVMVDGEEPLLKVEKVTPKTCFVSDRNGKQKKFMKSSCFPLYEQLSTNIIKVGNIVKFKYTEHPAIVRRINNGRIETTEGMDFHVSEVERLFSKEKQVIEYNLFSCGAVVHEDRRFSSKEEFEKEFPAFDCRPIEEKHSLLNVDIASHFNIKIEEIKPKEDTISYTLRTTLDHPLNVAKKRWALLVGPSGSGKTEAAIAYCNETNKQYVKLQGTAQLTVDDIIGYKSLTTGEYITSLLRDAVVNGKVFILDEIDACNPNTLLVLNGLKQEYFQFPDELVKIHKDFKFIGTANTLEYSEEYNARAPMDKATIARFKVIHYDMKPHELAVRYGFDYIKNIKNIDRLTPREIEGIVLDKRIEELVLKEKEEIEYA